MATNQDIAQPLGRKDFPEVAERVFDDCNTRVWQVISLLKLARGLLDASPHPDAKELQRLMNAIEVSIDRLEPVPEWIGCNQALANACNAKIAKDMEEEANA